MSTPSKRSYWPGSWLIFWLVIKPISLLPRFFLYRVADFLFFVLWHLVPYRRKVVMGNLSRSFPEKSSGERWLICREFYRHFADLVVESLRNFSITPQQCQRGLIQLNPEVLNKLAAEGRPVVLCGGHYGNWELWALAAPPGLTHRLIGIYKRLSNAFFDRKMRETRSRFGLHLVPTVETGNYLRTNPEEMNALVLGFDQSPSNPHKAYWLNFLGQDTGVYFGAEKFAKEFGRPVVYGSIRKVKRGVYEVTYTLVCSDPEEKPYGWITQELFTLLERDIRAQPEHWLWTHKRWKHKRPKNSDLETA